MERFVATVTAGIDEVRRTLEHTPQAAHAACTGRKVSGGSAVRLACKACLGAALAQKSEALAACGSEVFRADQHRSAAVAAALVAPCLVGRQQ